MTEGQSHRLEIVDYEGMAGFELTFVEMVFGDKSSVEPDTMFSAYQIDKKILKGVKDKDDEAEVRKEGSDKRYRFIKDLRKLSNDIKEENFKPIQGHSKNTETYDITKDEKFSYLLKLQELERERGIDVLRIMQKLEENGKKVVDKKV